MQKTKPWARRLTAFALLFCTILGLLPMLQMEVSATIVLDESQLVNLHKSISYNFMFYNIGNGRQSRRVDVVTFIDETTGGKSYAYCVEFGRPGIESIPDGELWPATYTTAVTDPQAVGIIMNGFPFKTPDELGLGSVLPEHKEMMAYYATQTALWSHLQGWNPVTTWEATPDTEMVKTAMLQIYNAGRSNPVNQNVTIAATPTSPTAVVEGEYLVQTYSVNAAAGYASYTVAFPASAPAGTLVTDVAGSVKTTFAAGEQFKVKMPKATQTEAAVSFSLDIKVDISEAAIFFAEYTGGKNYQHYAVIDPLYALKTKANFGAQGATQASPPGDSYLEILKVDAATKAGLGGSVFRVTKDGGDFLAELTTGGDGKAYLPLDVQTAQTLHITEISPPPGYCLSTDNHRDIYVEVARDTPVKVIFENQAAPTLTVTKVDFNSGQRLRGAIYEFEQLATGHKFTATSDAAGLVVVSDGQLEPGPVKVTEIQAPDGYRLSDPASQTINLIAGTQTALTFRNHAKPGLRLTKVNSSGIALSNYVFSIGKKNGAASDYATNSLGIIELYDLEPGWYTITEKQVGDAKYLLDSTPRDILLEDGELTTLVWEDLQKPVLHVVKEDSITSDRLAGIPFQIWRAKNNSLSGELIDLGIHYTNSSGEIEIITEVGWHRVRELEPLAGYSIKGSDTQDVFLEADKTRVVTFQNTPLSAIIIRKFGSVGEPVPDTWFQVRYLGGAVSGTGGTVIGNFKTSLNGTIVLTGMKAGYYIIEEVIPKEPEYELSGETQTIYLSGLNQDVVTVDFRNAKKGQLVIAKKSSADNGPVADCTFLVTDSSGVPIGPNNGLYTTDATGIIEVGEYLSVGSTVLVREVRCPDAFELDSTPQTVQIRENTVHTLTFYNNLRGSLQILKKNSVTHGGVANCTFFLTYSDGSVVGTGTGHYTTDASGIILITDENLKIGATVIATETACPEGYELDSTPQSVVIKANTLHTLTFYNAPRGTLQLVKKNSATGSAVADCTFSFTYADGSVVGPGNGYYTTDRNGHILIEAEYLKVGATIVVKEISCPDTFMLDSTPQSVTIKAGTNHVLTFYNAPRGTLQLVKKNAVTDGPVSGCTFYLSYSDGSVVGPDNGYYTTDRNGYILISNEHLEVGKTVIARETQAAPGFVLDSTPQSIVIRANTLHTLTFYNTPRGGLQIFKYDADTKKGLSNVELSVEYMNGQRIGVFTTDSTGMVYIPNIEGWITVRETKGLPGYLYDSSVPYNIEVKAGETAVLRIPNHKAAGLIIHKIDKDTKAGIYSAVFLLYDATMRPLMQLTTDQNGYIHVDQELEPGKYFLREMSCEGYVVDTQLKTLYIAAGKTTEIEWENERQKGQIQVIKRAFDESSITHLPEDSLLAGGVFEIIDPRTGNVYETIRSDSRGVAASSQIPLGRWFVREASAPNYYIPTTKVYEVELKIPGDIVRIEIPNKAVELGVTVQKHGNQQVMPGQQMTYDFSSISNASNVGLNDFYWHDRLPTDAVRISSIQTGTWSQRLTYRVMIKTNMRDYRVLADKLLTTNNYTLSCAPAAVGLMGGEYITDVRFEFGRVAAGFHEENQPRFTVTVLPNLPSEYRIINRTDVGGRYKDEWQTALDMWVTIVWSVAKPVLPKTGY